MREGGVHVIGETHDTDPLGDFAARHGQALTRFAFLLTGGRGDQAEDLVQSVLATLAGRGLDDLDDPASYARRMVLNLHRSLGRRAGAQLRALARRGRTTDVVTGPDIEQRDQVWRALDALSSRQRAAVVLRYYEDWPDEQIAEALGCAPGTVRSLVSRALPLLRERLDDAREES